MGEKDTTRKSTLQCSVCLRSPLIFISTLNNVIHAAREDLVEDRSVSTEIDSIITGIVTHPNRRPARVAVTSVVESCDHSNERVTFRVLTSSQEMF